MRVVGDFLLQVLPAPIGGGIAAKKVGAQVVVYAHDQIHFIRKKTHGFTSNQPGRAGYYGYLHII
jgi:hypothetical protein